MLTRVFIAAALVLAFASGVWADKSVTYFTVTLADVTSVCFQRSAGDANGWRAVATASVRGSTSSYAATAAGPVTAGQKTTIETYITNNVLGPLNTQEGL